MNISEEKIQELINNEIKQQVNNKMKQVGRDTIKAIYKEVVAEQVRIFILEQKIELSKDLKQEINYEKDVWKKAIVDKVSNDLLSRLDKTFYDSDYEDDY